MGIPFLIGNLGVLVLLPPFLVVELDGLLHVTIRLGKDVPIIQDTCLMNARIQTILARRVHYILIRQTVVIFSVAVLMLLRSSFHAIGNLVRVLVIQDSKVIIG
jgi:hypothetical protein